MPVNEARGSDGLPEWARAIGSQLVEDLIEAHMSTEIGILTAKYRLEISEHLSPRSRRRLLQGLGPGRSQL